MILLASLRFHRPTFASSLLARVSASREHSPIRNRPAFEAAEPQPRRLLLTSRLAGLQDFSLAYSVQRDHGQAQSSGNEVNLFMFEPWRQEGSMADGYLYNPKHWRDRAAESRIKAE